MILREIPEELLRNKPFIFALPFKDNNNNNTNIGRTLKNKGQRDRAEIHHIHIK